MPKNAVVRLEPVGEASHRGALVTKCGALVNDHGALVTTSGARATIDREVISLHDASGVVIARYDGERGELVLCSPGDVALSAPNGRVRIDATAIEMTASRAVLRIGHFELDAARIVERTHDVFRTAHGVAETHARRMRTLVERTLELVSGRTTVSSKEDTRIDGKRVLLG